MMTLEIDRRGAVDWVTFNRPDRLNALSPELVEALHEYFDSLSRDTDTRVVLLRGAGRAFCAGLDLGATGGGDLDATAHLAIQRRVSEIVLKMRYCPQAIVSLVHGPACGGGFAMALASDIRIAGASARMNAAFVRIGLSACDIGVSYFLPRLVGASLAAELMMTGDFIHAERALQLGLVSRVVADEDLEVAAEPLLDAMLTTSPLGLRLTKECLRMSIDAPSLEAAIAMEDRNQVIAGSAPEFQEGVAAFFEKRRPAYAAELVKRTKR
ncbi:Enoyl-CoA hydratase [Sphingobium indicum BiD32]|jgi:enoyl-CoA hydratase/carnithine racemase|uniref:Enoyl-CoA hydratase n=4 Tax=Sphingomonadaceae TaxID=41297 RepID=N1MKR4_9SPHN|nr:MULTISPECIES: enoyl-CoA hydratase/isomerase family protein [Sphingomonadaceae]MDX5986405.1 enoyl-CoA hydratase/isomerase family protein [Sphingomonas echinoides]WDA35466.1 enoyl-CoA hydratase/isomerase family protein [Sphingobium sp. YC-XJ3]CCW16053.1 Enoyl-CoA hydratase [Sphingobium indicum BiD32]